MKKSEKTALIILIILNLIVLLGQLWPEGAPPFARTANIVFLFASLIYFVIAVKNSGSATP